MMSLSIRLATLSLITIFLVACEPSADGNTAAGDNLPEQDARSDNAQTVEPDTTMADGVDDEMAKQAADTEAEKQTFQAVLAPTQGNSVTGTVRFTEADEGVRVDGAITGLQPGMHGFHIHENGDCGAADGSSAGGHYAPEGSPHGAPDAAADKRHMGDLGNVEADESGAAEFNFVDPVLELQGPDSIFGKAVIVHASEDDLSSQPSGAAGPRVACGVIG